jgi:hypothetical protein
MNIAVRCYVDNEDKPEQKEFEKYYNPNLVFVFDFETTADMYLNMMFGCCGIWENGKRVGLMLIHASDLNEKQLATLREYAIKSKIELISRAEFVRVFYQNVFKRRAVCVGFNLPFDISRMAISSGTSKNDRNSFSFKLSDKLYDPRITIKHIDSKSSFIGFTKPLVKNRTKVRKYAGTFVDLKTLSFALTDKSHSLESACEKFDVPHKKLKVEEHGKITSEYIDYCVNDVLATYDLYVALGKEFENYNLSIPLNSLYSPASIGKAYIKAMNIKPFSTQNSDFPKKMLGYIMSTYYGGRAEVHIRKQPVPVTYIDFTSMYPTMFELLGLQDYVIADSIDIIEDKEFPRLLDKITLSDLQDKGVWRKFRGIALVKADADIFPIRAKYGNKTVYNIGINKVKGKLYYAYPDIIATKLLTGKVPKIVKAYRFVSKGVQKDLKPIELFDKTIDTRKTSLIKAMIEHRLEVKEKLKHDKDNKELKNQDHIAKIIANSTSYGIYVEINTVPNAKTVDIYGLEHIETQVEKEEQQGKAFNPILATLITAGARLILAMAEAFVEQNNGYYAYCDTDSIFVDPSIVKDLQAFFRSLNPYSRTIEMFKVEKAEDGTLLDNVIFYGISAKRYCLYREDNGIYVLKHSSHGLGYITGMPKDWEKEFWVDILQYCDGKITLEEIKNKYENNVIVAQLSITSPRILKRFDSFNTNNTKRRIKPFNFINVGIGYRKDNVSNNAIIPAIPFTKDTKTVKYMPFVDYKTGKY